MATPPLKYGCLPKYLENMEKFLDKICKKSQRILVFMELKKYITEIFSSELPTIAGFDPEHLTPEQLEAYHLGDLPLTVPGPVYFFHTKKNLISKLIHMVMHKASLLKISLRCMELFPLVINPEGQDCYLNRVSLRFHDSDDCEKKLWCYLGTQLCEKIPITVYDPMHPPIVDGPARPCFPHHPPFPPITTEYSAIEFEYIIVTTETIPPYCQCAGKYHITSTFEKETENIDIETGHGADFCLPHIVTMETPCVPIDDSVVTVSACDGVCSSRMIKSKL